MNTGYADLHGARTAEPGAGEGRATPRRADKGGPSGSRPRTHRASRRYLTRDTAEDRGRKNPQSELRHSDWALQRARHAPAECRRRLAGDRRPTDGNLRLPSDHPGIAATAPNIYNV